MAQEVNVGRLFSAVCNRYGSRVAIKYANRNVTYTELDAMSNSLGTYLLCEGLKPNDVIAIVNTKGPEALALMIACLKVGVAYTNIDRDNPVQRIESILGQCCPRLVFLDCDASSALDDVCNRLGVKNCQLRDISSFPADNGLMARACNGITGNRIAYIMFTSGSTGVPKGAVMTHQNVLNFIAWTTERFRITPNDVFANISPFYFDNSVFDFFSALFSGAALVPVKKEVLSQPVALLDLIDDLGCTIWFSVPSMLIYLQTMKVLNNSRLRSIRAVVFGGEGFPKSELHKMYSKFANRMEFINVYGPTEATCICSSYTLTDTDFGDLTGVPSLGTMNSNFDYLILNDQGQKAERGELCILGPNIGMGYYRDQERSNPVFLEYSEHGFYRDRMYKTGDLVYESGGLLYFVGRVDNQIKHMGYRIELEEIELALNALPKVTQAAAIYERVSASYGKIIAFVACEEDLDSAEVKAELKKILPEYMIPNVVRTCALLPKNANGKVDRHKLREIIRDSGNVQHAA